MKYIAYLIWFIIEAALITFIVGAIAYGLNIDLGSTWNAVVLVVLFLLIFGGSVESTFNNLEQQERFKNEKNN